MSPAQAAKRILFAIRWSGTVKMVSLSALVGCVGALGSQAFMFLIHLSGKFLLTGITGYSPPQTILEGGATAQATGTTWHLLIPVATTIGGLLSGLLVFTFAPEARGHGTDAAIRSYHRLGGKIRARVPFVKAFASALTIGSGGSAGREGPIAQIGAGFGSLLANKLALGIAERRVLMLAGMAAGISASFKSPLGASLFTVEVLYSTLEFETGVLAMCIIASSVSYAVNGFFSGWTPLFHIPAGLHFSRASDLLWYTLLGLACGVVASVIPYIFYRTEEFFGSLKMPEFLKTTLGFLMLGILAAFLPQILAGGYGTMESAVQGGFPIALLLMLAFAKIVGFSLTIGSGGSGGVFAPVLFVGCMLGAAVAQTLDLWVPFAGGGPDPHAMAIVGMGALFAAAARVPIASLIITAEMTGGYGLIMPTMFAVTMAFLVQSAITSRKFKNYQTLYRAQVPTRVDSPTHQQEYVELGLQLLKGQSFSLPESISLPNLTNLLRFGAPVPIGAGGNYLFTTVIPENSPVIGKSVADVRFVDRILIASIIRKGNSVTPRGSTKLELEDQLIVICSQADFSSLKEEIVKGPPADPTAAVLLNIP